MLGLIPVSVAVTGPPPPSPQGGAATVRAEDSLRTALSTLLQSGAPALVVIEDGGRAVGSLTFEDIRRAVVVASSTATRS